MRTISEDAGIELEPTSQVTLKVGEAAPVKAYLAPSLNDRAVTLERGARPDLATVAADTDTTQARR